MIDPLKLNLRRKLELPVDNRNPAVGGRVLSLVLGVDVLFLFFANDVMDVKPLQDERGEDSKEVDGGEDGEGRVGGDLARERASRKACSDRSSMI